ncbi:MAG: secretin N-terminal domain-containing protein [Pirellulaceae bacterium]
MIGWGDAVATLTELVHRLDVPTNPTVQFEVFPLRHASADEVAQTLEDFFSDRGGLGPNPKITVDQRTNSVVVHAAGRDLNEVRTLIARLDVPQGERLRRVRVFQIENSLADDVAATLQDALDAASPANGGAALELLTIDGAQRELLRSGVLEDVQITSDARNNQLIVTGPAASFDLIEALIRQLDAPGMVVKIKIFPVVNGDAGAMVETLRALIPSQTGTQVGPRLSSEPGETGLSPLRFTVDSRSNSVIATGSDGDLRIVEALILRLDEGDAMQRRTAVYQLKNAPAVDVALSINEFLRSRRQVESAAPGQANPFQQLEKEVVVVPEPVANKLILSATPRYFEEIEQLIERLDEQPPQVMIQVLIAEVTLGEADEFGVELGIQDSVLFDRSLLGDLVTTDATSQISTPAGVTTTNQQTIQAASNVPGFDFNNTSPLGNSGSQAALAAANMIGGQGISNFSVGRANDELGFGGLVLSASSQNVSVLLRSLQETRRMEVLSRPQVRTLDNQPAFIQIGQRVPRIANSTTNQNGQTNSVLLENVGLILAVTPRIGPDGTVVMEIDAEKSSLGPELEGIPVSVSVDGTIIRAPRIDTTTAQATVSRGGWRDDHPRWFDHQEHGRHSSQGTDPRGPAVGESTVPLRFGDSETDRAVDHSHASRDSRRGRRGTLEADRVCSNELVRGRRLRHSRRHSVRVAQRDDHGCRHRGRRDFPAVDPRGLSTRRRVGNGVESLPTSPTILPQPMGSSNQLRDLPPMLPPQSQYPTQPGNPWSVNEPGVRPVNYQQWPVAEPGYYGPPAQPMQAPPSSGLTPPRDRPAGLIHDSQFTPANWNEYREPGPGGQLPNRRSHPRAIRAGLRATLGHDEFAKHDLLNRGCAVSSSGQRTIQTTHVPRPKRSKMQVRITPLAWLLSCSLLVASFGCHTLKTDWSMPWEKETEPVLPDRILAVWSDTVLHQPGQPGVRGFGGRLFFYEDESTEPVPVDGGVDDLCV